VATSSKISRKKELKDMKPHLTLSTTSQHAHAQGDTAEAVADRVPANDGQTGLPETAYARPQLTLASAPVWGHQLILTGRLDQRSAPELEEEIECLCEEGVTTLTLDLRQLEAIDSTGVTAIARRGAVCKMRGHDFEVIPGSRVIRRALAEAGATDLLTCDPNASVARRLPSHSARYSAAYRSTAMVKSL
jgi:anti-anti-sigma factor